MEIVEKCFYHIKDDYFALACDPLLMANKENGRFRPNFLALRDPSSDGVFWMVPVSCKVEKYKKIVDEHTRRYGESVRIVLWRCDGRDAAYLIQNAFPVTAAYIDHPHISGGMPLCMNDSSGQKIERAFLRCMNLHKRGVRVFFSDVDRLYNLMLNAHDRR